MAMQVEQDTCTGRGFSDTDAAGWCAKFKTWVVKNAAAGGPGWYILLDRSTQPVLKSISAVNTTTEEITATAHGLLQGEPVRFSTTGTQIGGLTTGTKYYVTVVSADVIKVSASWKEFLAGTFVNLTSAGSGNSVILFGPYIVVSDIASPAIQDSAKILKVGYETSRAGYVTLQTFLTRGLLTDCHPLGVWSGVFLKTVDAGPFTYNFRGNSEFLLLQSRPPSEALWYRFCIDEFTPLSGFLEDDALHYGITAADFTLTLGVETTVTLATSGQVDSLTKGEGYFIYGAKAGSGKVFQLDVSYGVISKKGVADGLTDTQIAFTMLGQSIATAPSTIYTGARITPFYHKHVTWGNCPYLDQTYGNVADFNYSVSTSRYLSLLPYASNFNSGSSYFCTHPQTFTAIQTNFSASVETAVIDKGAQDNSTYVVQRPAAVESLLTGGTGGANRIYGEVKNAFFTYLTGMTDMETGRVVGANDLLSQGVANQSFNGTGISNEHVLVINTESV